VENDDGGYNQDESGNYVTVENNGPLRIVEASSDEIELVTRDGHRYIFDLNSRMFTPLKSEPPYVRHLDEGAIWETGNAPVITDEYTFWNFWLLEENNEQVYVFAGATNNDPSQGVLIKYSIKLNEDKRRGVVYFTPINDGPTRIVDIVDGKLITVTLHGMEYAFDVENEQLFEFDHNKTEFSPINPIYQAQPIEFKESETDTLVSPTISPTVTQTITHLPSATPPPIVPYP
jgi:hypothetical protein